jgi:hypothetical protein
MILKKAKLKHYKNIKREREQEQDLDLNNQKLLNAWQMPPFIGQNLELLI